MKTILQRLRRGERVWTAELALRSAGAVLLYACLLAWRCDCRLVAASPAHDGTPVEMAVALLVWACLSTGLALTLVGPGLLRRVPLPPRALLP